MNDNVNDNDNPERIHLAEQWWAEGQAHLQAVLDDAEGKREQIYANALGNTDDSVIFDYWKTYIISAEDAGHKLAEMLSLPSNPAHVSTIAICAAALTMLMRKDDRMQASTVLAEMERNMSNDDDH